MDLVVKFFNSHTWCLLKKNKTGIIIAYEILSNILGHEYIMFVDDNSDVIHDPTNMYLSLTDEHKYHLSKITSGDDYELKYVDGKIMKKVGSAVVLKDTSAIFVPFDKSY